MAVRVGELVQRAGSQSALARKAGVSQSRISQLEAGGELGLDVAVKLAEAMGCSLDWLVLGRESGAFEEGVAVGEARVRDELAPYVRAIAAVTQLAPGRPGSAPAPPPPPESGAATPPRPKRERGSRS